MAYACDICGKGKQYGHNVSFSQRKTQKVWKPNLQRQYINLGDSRVQVKICTQCLRTLNKYRQQDKLTDEAPVEADAAAKPVTKKAPAKKPAAKASK